MHIKVATWQCEQRDAPLHTHLLYCVMCTKSSWRRP